MKCGSIGPVFHNVAAAQFIVTAACRVASSSSLTCAHDFYISLKFFNYENLKEAHQSSYFTLNFKLFLMLQEPIKNQNWKNQQWEASQLLNINDDDKN